MKLGLKVSGAGYVKVSYLAKLNRLHGLTEDDVKTIATRDNKNRFKWMGGVDGMMVRANQGHTFALKEDEIFTPIRQAEELDACIHGTYSNSLPSIMKTGLSKMKRTHVHFTPSPVVTEEARSGFRGTCDILIHLDVRKALSSGLKLFRSDNNVILCPGDENERIASSYFAKVENRWTGEVLYTNKACPKPAAQPEPMDIDPPAQKAPAQRKLRPEEMNVTNDQSHSGCIADSPSPKTPPGFSQQGPKPSTGVQQKPHQPPPQTTSFQENQQADMEQQNMKPKPMSYADRTKGKKT